MRTANQRHGFGVPESPPQNSLSMTTSVNNQPNYQIGMDVSGFGDQARGAWDSVQGLGGNTTAAAGRAGASTQQVQGNQLMSNQLNSLLDADNPYMNRARQSGLDLAHQRGLGNSSIAAGNAMGAAIDRAAPIAQFDAGRYGSVADQNMAAQNQASLLNAQLSTQANLQNARNDQQMQAMLLGHQLGGLDDFRRHMLNMENREDTQAFGAGQADIDRFINQNQFGQTMNLQNRQLDSQNWQHMQNGFMSTINSIYMNPNLSAEQQAAAVNQVRQQFPGFTNEAWQMLPPGVMSDRSVRAAQAMPPMPPLRGRP